MAGRKTNVSPRLMTFFKVNSDVSTKLRSGALDARKGQNQEVQKVTKAAPVDTSKISAALSVQASRDIHLQSQPSSAQPAVLVLPIGKLTPVRFSSPIGYTILVTQPNCRHESKNILHKMAFEDAEQRGFPVYSLDTESFDLYPVNPSAITQFCNECTLNVDKLTTPVRKAIVMLDFTALDTITIDDCGITVRKPEGFMSQQEDVIAINTASPEFRDAIFDVNLFLTNLFDKTLCANFTYLIVSSEFKAMMTTVKYKYYDTLKVFDPVITLDSVTIEESPLAEELEEFNYTNEVIDFKPTAAASQEKGNSQMTAPPPANNDEAWSTEIFIPTSTHARFIKHITFNSTWAETTLLVCLFEAGLKHWLPMLEKHDKLVIGGDYPGAHRLVCDTYDKWIHRESIAVGMVRDAFTEACYNMVDNIQTEFSFMVSDSLTVLVKRAD